MKKKKKAKRVVLTVLIVILSVVFVVSAGVFLFNVIRSAKERKANEELRDIVQEARLELETAEYGAPGTDTGTDETGDPATDGKDKKKSYVYADSGVLYGYDKVWQRNKDMVAWLEIPGTSIAYPVVYTPDYIEKYLRMAFDGSWAISGTLFLGEGWDPDGNFSLVFGHHMNDGTMFGKLMDYYADRESARYYKTIIFDTLKEKKEYEVVTAFYARVDDVEDDRTFSGYYVRGLPDETNFNNYMAKVRSAAIYEPLTDVEWGDDLLLLSTCSSFYSTNERFVVVARYRP